jgi:hypothetical protein
MNTTEILLKVVECIELTFEICESCIIIRMAKAFSITASRVHNRAYKTSLRAQLLSVLVYFTP